MGDNSQKQSYKAYLSSVFRFMFQPQNYSSVQRWNMGHLYCDTVQWSSTSGEQNLSFHQRWTCLIDSSHPVFHWDWLWVPRLLLQQAHFYPVIYSVAIYTDWIPLPMCFVSLGSVTQTPNSLALCFSYPHHVWQNKTAENTSYSSAVWSALTHTWSLKTCIKFSSMIDFYNQI